MRDLLVALALMLAIEGLLFAAFPDAMRRAMIDAAELPPTTMRVVGFIAAVLGIALIALLRGVVFS